MRIPVSRKNTACELSRIWIRDCRRYSATMTADPGTDKPPDQCREVFAAGNPVRVGVHRENGYWWFRLRPGRKETIDSRDQEKLFRGFPNCAAQITVSAGDGPGLAICKEIIDRHHGRKYHRPGKAAGTSSVSLFRARGTDMTVAQEKIQIVDDEAEIALILETATGRRGICHHSRPRRPGGPGHAERESLLQVLLDIKLPKLEDRSP